jgi:hypothetical protein
MALATSRLLTLSAGSGFA